MDGYFNRVTVSMGFVLLSLGQATAEQPEVRFCEDSVVCLVGEACVAGKCTAVENNNIRLLFPVAIDRVVDFDKGTRKGPIADRVDRWLRRHFDLSGFFRVLPEERNPGSARLESLRVTTVDFQAWYQAGAYAVVKGSVRRSRPGKYNLTLRLFLTEEGVIQTLPLEVQELSDGDWIGLKRAVAQWVDDIVVHYSGKGGAFSSRIAFARRMKRGGAKEIYVMDADGDNVQPITGNGNINMLPGWTRDGRVAYTSFLDHNPDLWIEGKKFSKYPRMNTGAAFHPNGKSLAITLSKDGNAEIYILHARTAAPIRRLTRHNAIDTSPSWSPDGKQLVFVSDRGNGRPAIYRMSALGGQVKRLPQVGGYNTSPDWSPSGHEIAYSAMVGSGRFDIFTIQLKTGNVRRLTSRGSNEEPSYSKDGRYIVFSSTRGRGRHLWIMTSGGNNKRRLSHGPGEFLTPAWER